MRYRGIITLLVFCRLFTPAFSQGRQTLNMSDYGLKSNDCSDAVPFVVKALAECKRLKAKKLIFPKGTYNFHPDKAEEKYLFISNNDEGLKRIAFQVEGLDGLEIDGQGSQFIFHGYICPFVITNSKNISLKNFSVDWERTFHSEATIENLYKDSIDVSFSDEYPYFVKNSLLQFTDKEKRDYPFKSLLEFDSQKRETAFKAKDYYTGPYIRVRQIGGRLVRLFVPEIKGKKGNVLVFGAAHRLCPGITITDSENTKLTGITLHHAGGMGVIAQGCENVFIDSIRVTPSHGRNRIVSTSADATHFVNCRGKIEIKNSLFENQEDDATNIHGVYAQISNKVSSYSLEVKLKHEQQFGFNLARPGDSVEFVHSANMNTYYKAIVQSATRLNKEYILLTFSKILPEAVLKGDVIANLKDASPDVLIQGCIIRNNRARGILLGSRGNIIVENNIFHTPGAAILFEGDASFWFEQAGVRNVKISRNVFDNCNYGVWGNSVIQVGSGIAKTERGNSRYNRNIHIESNTFTIFDPRIIHAYSVDRLVFRGNTIRHSSDYENQFSGQKHFDISNSSGIDITD